MRGVRRCCSSFRAGEGALVGLTTLMFQACETGAPEGARLSISVAPLRGVKGAVQLDLSSPRMAKEALSDVYYGLTLTLDRLGLQPIGESSVTDFLAEMPVYRLLSPVIAHQNRARCVLRKLDAAVLLPRDIDPTETYHNVFDHADHRGPLTRINAAALISLVYLFIAQTSGLYAAHQPDIVGLRFSSLLQGFAPPTYPNAQYFPYDPNELLMKFLTQWFRLQHQCALDRLSNEASDVTICPPQIFNAHTNREDELLSPTNLVRPYHEVSPSATDRLREGPFDISARPPQVSNAQTDRGNELLSPRNLGRPDQEVTPSATNLLSEAFKVTTRPPQVSNAQTNRGNELLSPRNLMHPYQEVTPPTMHRLREGAFDISARPPQISNAQTIRENGLLSPRNLMHPYQEVTPPAMHRLREGAFHVSNRPPQISKTQTIRGNELLSPRNSMHPYQEVTPPTTNLPSEALKITICPPHIAKAQTIQEKKLLSPRNLVDPYQELTPPTMHRLRERAFDVSNRPPQISNAQTIRENELLSPRNLVGPYQEVTPPWMHRLREGAFDISARPPQNSNTQENPMLLSYFENLAHTRQLIEGHGPDDQENLAHIGQPIEGHGPDGQQSSLRTPPFQTYSDQQFKEIADGLVTEFLDPRK